MGGSVTIPLLCLVKRFRTECEGTTALSSCLPLGMCVRTRKHPLFKPPAKAQSDLFKPPPFQPLRVRIPPSSTQAASARLCTARWQHPKPQPHALHGPVHPRISPGSGDVGDPLLSHRATGCVCAGDRLVPASASVTITGFPPPWDASSRTAQARTAARRGGESDAPERGGMEPAWGGFGRGKAARGGDSHRG